MIDDIDIYNISSDPHKYCLRSVFTKQTSEQLKIATERCPERCQLVAKMESIDEIVTVPAGNFKGCLKIKRSGNVKQTINRGFLCTQIVNITVEDYTWYAPGIGLVKGVRKETKQAGFESEAVEATIELVSAK